MDIDFFPIMPSKKNTVLIKFPHKMTVYILNKDHICKLCMCMHAFEKYLRNKLNLAIFSFNVYFKMATSIGSNFENIKLQYLNE